MDTIAIALTLVVGNWAVVMAVRNCFTFTWTDVSLLKCGLGLRAVSGTEGIIWKEYFHSY